MTSPISLELQAKIASWRQRCMSNEITLEEMKEAVLHMRAGRVSAATAATASRKVSGKKSVAPPADDMLSELEGL